MSNFPRRFRVILLRPNCVFEIIISGTRVERIHIFLECTSVRKFMHNLIHIKQLFNLHLNTFYEYWRFLFRFRHMSVFFLNLYNVFRCSTRDYFNLPWLQITRTASKFFKMMLTGWFILWLPIFLNSGRQPALRITNS